jgi:hypothetical protein
MSRLGNLILQAMDDTDVFFNQDLYLDGVRDGRETQDMIAEPGFEENNAWISGDVPDSEPVWVEGDTSVIYGWFKGENFAFPFRVKIYIEYEEVEELICEEEEKP